MMLPVCLECGALLEYDPGTGCMECPNEGHKTADKGKGNNDSK